MSSVALPSTCVKTGLWLYRHIDGFPNYLVYFRGQVVRGEQWRSTVLVKSTIKPDNRNGYLRVQLRDSTGKLRWRPIHTLVLEAFIGPRPTPKHHGAHSDGNSHNNAFDNLQWKLPVHNEADKKLHGTAPRGGHKPPTHPARLRAIRKRVAAGESFTAVAKRFRMHRSSVAKIAKKEAA